MKPTALATILLFTPLCFFAQLNDDGIYHCGLSQAEAALEARHAHSTERVQETEQARKALEAHTRAFAENGLAKSGVNFVIPVVFHIIHNYGAENIGNEQVYDAVEFLNKDFSQQNSNWQTVNPAFLNLVADVGIEFRLAQKDPNGNCTNGITRTVSTETYVGGQDMKDLIQWPRNEYLNVWVSAEAGGAAAYALYPGSVNSSWNAGADGIVTRHTYVGSIGTGALSRVTTLAHEVGHWLNLRHTWGNSNDANLISNCNVDDLVGDTPNTIGWTSCNVNATSCGSLDNVENYMDYAGCRKMFTEGQKVRMLAALNSSTAQRNQLWQPSNLADTGTEGPSILCNASLTSNHTVICVGDSVEFADASYNGATGWDWEFPGGSPSTASTESAVIYYDTPGTYDVSITADNGNDFVNITENQYITVLSSDGYPLPYSEGFENLNSVPSNDWFIFDGQDDGSFQVSSSAAYSGSKSIKLTNNTNDASNLDEMVSNTIDMSGMQDAVITFKYAYRRRNSQNDDRLRFYVSSDCGRSWSLREQLRGQTDLSTGNNVGGSFTPSGTGDWMEAVIDNIQPNYLQSNFRFKFWFESDGGNNLWLDDINITATPVGIEELSAESIGLNIFPNPLTDVSTLAFELKERADVQMDIVDVLGRTIVNMSNGSLSAGQHQYPISKQDMGTGMYFIRMLVNDKSTMIKFMVN